MRDLGSRFVGSREFVDVALRNSINKGVIVGPANAGRNQRHRRHWRTLRSDRADFAIFFLDANRITRTASQMALMKSEKQCGLRLRMARM